MVELGFGFGFWIGHLPVFAIEMLVGDPSFFPYKNIKQGRPTVAEWSKASVFLDRGRGRLWVQIPTMPNLIIVFLLEIGLI